MSIEFAPAFDRRTVLRNTGAPLVQDPPFKDQHGRDARANETATPKRSSPRRIAANRRNAKRSTGPRTLTGKKRASRNALKHGLAAIYGARLPSESGPTFNTFVRELQDDLQPRTLVQRALFPQIANLMWRLQRLPQAQSDLFTEELDKSARCKKGETLSPAQVLARRFSDDPQNGFILLDRYERCMRNSLLRLMKQFEQLKKNRSAAGSADSYPADEPPVPTEGSQPAWTEENSRAQAKDFDRRKREMFNNEPHATNTKRTSTAASASAPNSASPLASIIRITCSPRPRRNHRSINPSIVRENKSPNRNPLPRAASRTSQRPPQTCRRNFPGNKPNRTQRKTPFPNRQRINPSILTARR